MAKTGRTRIAAENAHRRVTRPRLRIIVQETRGYPTGYLRASSDTIQHGPESREVGCETSFFLSSLWLSSIRWYHMLRATVCATCAMTAWSLHIPRGHARRLALQRALRAHAAPRASTLAMTMSSSASSAPPAELEVLRLSLLSSLFSFLSNWCVGSRCSRRTAATAERGRATSTAARRPARP